MAATSIAVAASETSLVYATAVLVAVSFVATGLVAWRVHPRNRLGPPAVAVGLMWILAKFPLPVPGWIDA